VSSTLYFRHGRDEPGHDEQEEHINQSAIPSGSAPGSCPLVKLFFVELRQGWGMTSAKLQRILCAEDEPIIQAILRAALERLGGFTVKICGSGEEALAAAAEFAPDLVLLDVMMPGMDGRMTLAALRRLPALENIPIAFITTIGGSREIDDFLELGAVGVIIKPFEPKQLAETVRQIWVNARGRDRG
jgi:CheY-like chemotaxis protein